MGTTRRKKWLAPTYSFASLSLMELPLAKLSKLLPQAELSSQPTFLMDFALDKSLPFVSLLTWQVEQNSRMLRRTLCSSLLSLLCLLATTSTLGMFKPARSAAAIWTASAEHGLGTPRVKRNSSTGNHAAAAPGKQILMERKSELWNLLDAAITL